MSAPAPAAPTAPTTAPAQKVATVPKNKNAPKWITFICVAFTIAVISLFFYVKSDPKSEKKNSPSTQTTTPATEVHPPFLDSFITLKKGEEVMLKNYDGWILHSTNGGTSEKPKLYKRKHEGGEWETWGDGTNHSIDRTGYFELFTASDTMIKIRVWYKKEN